MYRHTYMCIYIYRERERDRVREILFWGHCEFHVFDRGAFWVLPLNCYLPSTFFPNVSKLVTFQRPH